MHCIVAEMDTTFLFHWDIFEGTIVYSEYIYIQNSDTHIKWQPDALYSKYGVISHNHWQFQWNCVARIQKTDILKWKCISCLLSRIIRWGRNTVPEELKQRRMVHKWIEWILNLDLNFVFFCHSLKYCATY